MTIDRILLLAMLLLTSAVHADIYKWTDTNGVVHFSDKPAPGAQSVHLPPSQSISIEKLAPPLMEDPISEHHGGYEKIRVVQPDNEATIRDNQGSVPVIINVEPALQPDDKIQLVVDGASMGSPNHTVLFELNNLNRGAHTIAAELLDASGKVLLTSDVVTIYMQRPRVGMVPETRQKTR